MRRTLIGVLLALVGLTAACGGGGSSSTGIGGGGGDTGKFCDAIKAERAASNQSSSFDDNAELDKLVSIAPSDIKKEMQQLQAFDALASSAATDSGKSAQFESQLTDVQNAVDKITAFVKDKCGVDLNSDTGSKLDSAAASSIN